MYGGIVVIMSVYPSLFPPSPYINEHYQFYKGVLWNSVQSLTSSYTQQFVQRWSHEPKRTTVRLPRISFLGMPKEESLVSQVTKSKIDCRQVNFSPTPFSVERTSEGSRDKAEKYRALTSFSLQSQSLLWSVRLLSFQFGYICSDISFCCIAEVGVYQCN